MTTQYTPGPWKLSAGIVHAGGHAIASLPIGSAGTLNGLTNTDEVAANARLIAAAPDLLAALEHVAVVASPGHRTFDQIISDMYYLASHARAAIAKAKGL